MAQVMDEWRFLQIGIDENDHIQGYAVNHDGSAYLIYRDGQRYHATTQAHTADGKMVYQLVETPPAKGWAEK